MSTTATVGSRARRSETEFAIAWAFCVVFYFVQYALRSSPGVMIPELTATFGLSALGVGSLVGLYYYTYSTFALVAGASVDRLGAKYSVPAGIVLVAFGAILFGLGVAWAAELGRLLQGAGSAFAFTGAVYLAARGFPAAYLATAVGFTQCFGLLGASAGQFLVAPLIHGPITWQQFWIYSGCALLILAVLSWLVTPDGRSAAPGAKASFWSVLAPYKTVLTNPQSYLCGVIAGLLFLPTTVYDMIWAVPMLREGFGLDYGPAVHHVAMVTFGWVIGCPLLGFIADKVGRKPVLIAGAALMLLSRIAVLYVPAELLYFCGLALGIGSGAGMIPYTVIKEVNPDEVKGSATGAMNFMVFTITAWMTPVFGWFLMRLSGGGPLSLAVFQRAGVVWVVVIAIAIALTFLLRETGAAARRAAP